MGEPNGRSEQVVSLKCFGFIVFSLFSVCIRGGDMGVLSMNIFFYIFHFVKCEVRKLD